MILFPNGIQGLSDSKWSGVRGSAHRLVGIDYRSEPGVIKAHQKLTKASGNVVTELCKVSLPLSDGSTLWFSSESGKIWREVSGTFTLVSTFTIPGYGMSLRGPVETGNFKSISAQIATSHAFCFKPDGLTMYVLGNATVSGNNGEVFQYTLTTAFDISTATYATKTKVVDIHARSMAFSSDGTKMYIGEDGGSNTIITYTLGTAWDVSTAGTAGSTFSFVTQSTEAISLNFNTTGTKMIILDSAGYKIHQYDLGTAWDITTASFVATFNLPTAVYTGGCSAPDGSAYFLHDSNGLITEYSLSTAWDVSTAVLTSYEYTTSATILFGLSASPDGNNFYAGTQSGTTAYQYEVTQIAEDLNVTVLGAEEYGVPDGADGPDEDTDDDEMTQYVYFATKNWLLRISLANITDWTQFEYLTLFKYGDETYHPMKIANNRLFVGDKYTILQVDEFGVITLETDFNVREPERITNLHNFDVDLLVATKLLNGRYRILRWDTESETWYGEDVIYDGQIHAFLDDDNFTYAIAGDFGQMYYYDGEKLIKHNRIPGSYSSTAKSKVNPNAVGYFMGIPVFGLSNIAGNPTLQGVYSYGQYSKDYAVTLDLSFPISSGEFSGLEIGSIVVQGTDLYVSWKSATAVGVDKIDWTAKYNGAYIETMVLNNAKDRSKFKSIKEVLADYIEMPENTAVAMAYSVNYSSYVTFSQVPDEKLYQLKAVQTVPEIGAVQVKFTFTTSADTTPKIENFHTNFVGEE